MGDLEQAAHSFHRYLDLAPASAPDRGEAEQALLAVEQQVRGHAVKDERGDTSPEKLTHTVIEVVPPDTAVDVRASLPKKDAKAYVYYRVSGEARFTRIAMRSRGVEKVARIPADALSGVAMEYYIEARDARDDVIQTSGTPDKPNIVLVDSSAQPQLAMVDTGRRRSDETAGERNPESPHLRELDDEVAPIADGRPGRTGGSERKLGGVFYSGLVMAVVGAGGLAVGIAGNLIAKNQADALTKDSQASNSFQFSDPNAPGCPTNCRDDASFQAQGKLWNTIGIAGTVAGGVLLAAGSIMMIVDGARSRHRGWEKPPRKPRHQEDAWYVAPSVGTRLVGLGGGFSF
jgi:hypothetical protein